MTAQTVVIVGGGVGGLAAGIRLAVAGREVVLFEKNPSLGGKLNLWTAPHPGRPGERPFTFDTGPSLLTLPFVFEELFAAAGEKLSDHLDLVRLDPIARFVWADGRTFELRPNPDDMRRQVAALAPADVAGWDSFAERGRKVWDLTADLFLQHAPEQVLRGDGFSPANALRMLSTPFRIGMFRTFAGVVDAAVTGQRLREVLYQYATYSGASPFRAPATLAVIPHAELHFGGWYPRGGMYRLAAALETVARKVGVKFRLGSPVERILIEPPAASLAEPPAASLAEPSASSGGGKPNGKKPKIVGVRLADGEIVPAGVVIANSDVVHTYRHLIDPAHRRRYPDATLDQLDPGGSGMVLLLGVDGEYPQLAHHTKFMPADYRDDLRSMFETKSIPTDPCVYVCATTRTDPTQAPPGCENLFVLASAPALDGKLDWSTAGPIYRDHLVRVLEEKWGLEGLSKRIVVERRITPADLKSLYNANAGTIYGLGSNSRRAAFLRPPNRDREVAGLFFCGGATHPGGGLPLVALSGKIVSELVLGDR